MDKITWTTQKRRLGDLRDWDKNPRQLSKHDAEHIGKSLDRFGLADPLIINADNSLIGGHQRKRIIGDPDALVDVRVPSRQLTEREAEELAIRLNKNSGDWDWDILANQFEVPDLIDWGFSEEELTGGGFDLEDEKPDDPGAQIDRAEELREKWGVETGQLWQLGEHRLICGDCTDKAMVERVMRGEKAMLLFTYPPYLDARDYGGNDLEVEKIIEFIPIFKDCAELQAVNLGIIRRENEIIRYWDKYIEVAENNQLKLLSWNIWNREDPYSMAQQTAMFPIEHEFIFVFGQQRKEINKTIPNKHPGERTGLTNRQKDGTLSKPQQKDIGFYRRFGTVFTCRPASGKDIGHPAMFPVDLPEAYIGACSIPGDVISDPFLGSGTTLIACERLGRKCRAVEISPAYCAVAIQRFYDMTGIEPVLLEIQS